MANDNTVSFGTVGSGNTINVTQRQDSGAPHIEYRIANNSVERLAASEVHQGALVWVGSIALPILALVADSVGVLAFLGFQTKWVLAVVVPFAICGAILTNTKRKMAFASFSPKVAHFIDGRWVEKEGDGSYARYTKAAKCIYPKCQGTVYIQQAPVREHPNHTLVGVCDVGGHRHTYTVDFNGVGFPQQFDWRELESKTGSDR